MIERAGVRVTNQPLCGDTTCQSYSCTQAAIDAWYEQQEENARQIVQILQGLVPAPSVASLC